MKGKNVIFNCKFHEILNSFAKFMTEKKKRKEKKRKKSVFLEVY